MATPLADLAYVFLRLGVTSFGGPAVHIAQMEEEVVGRRKWLTRDEFLDLLGATNLIPGPNSTEMAIHIGHRRAGWPGLVLAGSCFIIPASIIVLAIAWAYVRFKSLPQVEALMYGVKPVVIAVVLQALWRLARTAVKDDFLGFVGATSALACYLGVNELVVLLVAGLVVASRRWSKTRPLTAVAVPAISLSAATPGLAFSLGALFLTFLKIGAVLFGSGYVLLAFLRADLVDRFHWMTEGQLLDAVAVGQVTPGPVFTAATFIGYLLGGLPGAVLATLGIFLPAFVFVALSGPLVPRLRKSHTAGAFLDGVNVASLALMAVVTWELGHAALVDAPTVLLALGSAAVLLTTRLSSVWLVAAGAVTGLVSHVLR